MLIIVPRQYVKVEEAKSFGLDLTGNVVTPPLTRAGVNNDLGLVALTSKPSEVEAFITLHGLKVVDDRALDDAPGWRIKTKPSKEPLRHSTAPPSLDDNRAVKIQKIDARTDALVSSGFTVDSKTFSASDSAQLKWLGMFTSRAVLSYPVTVPTLNDKDFVTLTAAADIEVYYNVMLTRIQAVLTEGVLLKKRTAAATSQAELDAIVDDRT